VATITSTTSGNWGTGSTWVGGVAPGDGDVAIIATGHTVTLTGNVTIGTSPASATTYQLDIQGTGQLDLDGYSITVKGSVLLGAGSGASMNRIVGGPGAGLYIDGTAQPTVLYVLQANASGNYYSLSGVALTGTSGTPCNLGVIGGKAQIRTAELFCMRSLYLEHTNISGWGTSSESEDGFQLDLHYNETVDRNISGISIRNCRITNCGRFNLTPRQCYVTFEYNYWTNASAAMNQSFLFGAGVRNILRYSDIPGGITLSGDWSTSYCNNLIVRFTIVDSTSAGPIGGIHHILVACTSTPGVQSTFKSAVSQLYYLVHYDGATEGNPHFVIGGVGLVIDDAVFEARGLNFYEDTGDVLDAFNLSGAVTIKNTVVLPAYYETPSNDITSGAIWGGTSNSSGKLNIEHCTLYAPGAVQYPHGNGTGVADMIRLKSNLFWAKNAASVGGVSVDTAITGDELTTEKNAWWNVAAGSNTVGGTPTSVVGYTGTIQSTNPGATDVVLGSSPGFIDATRSFFTWAESVGATGADSNALRESALALVRADYTLIDDVLDYVQGGFVPTNNALLGAHDGAGLTIGAMPVGVAPSTGTLSVTLGATTLSATGTAGSLTPSDGTLAVTLGATTLAATGAAGTLSTATGTLNVTLGATTLAATGLADAYANPRVRPSQFLSVSDRVDPVFVGGDAEFTITLRDRAGAAIVDTYAGTEPLDIDLWLGDDAEEVVLTTSTVAWREADEGTVVVNLKAADTADLSPPGYWFRLWLTDGGKLCAFQEWLPVQPTAGTGDPPRVYGGFAAIVDEWPGVIQLIAATTTFKADLGDVRHKAALWVDRQVMARFRRDLERQMERHAVVVDVDPITPEDGVDFGPLWGPSIIPDTTLRDQLAALQGHLDAGLVLGDPQLEEIATAKALSLVFSTQSAPEYVGLASRYAVRANRLLASYTVRIDTDEDGVADLWANP
jgi:hypothetical protein